MTPPDPLGALVVPAPATTPVPGAAAQPGANGDPAAAEEFEFLVSRLLADGGEAPTPTTAPGAVLAELASSPLPGTTPAPVTEGAADEEGDEADATGGTGPDATAPAVLTGAAALLLPPPVVRAALASAPAATGDSAPAVTPTEPGATPRTGATESAPGSAPTPAGPGPTATPDATTSPDETLTVAVPPVALPDAGPAPEASPPATPSTAASATVPVTGAAPARADVTASAPTAVTRQVFPEVVRLASSGEGTATQRVTLMLKPESLGEVRVVLTTRHGELQVSLSAGGDTHRALLEGTPELRRLLETIGSPDARVVVRDLPGPTPAPQSSAPRADTTTDLSSGPGAGTGHPGDGPDPRSSGRQSTTATDGTHDAAIPQRRTESVTRARTTGLDVTM